MNEKIVTFIANFLARKIEFEKNSEDYQILKYGIELIYYDTTKTIVLLLASLILNILPYTLLFMLVFGSIKHFARGIHLKSNTLCTIICFINYLAGIYISINLTINTLITIIIFIFCFLLNLLYSPSPTKNSPIEKDKKLPLKISTLKVMAVYFIIILLIGESTYRNIILIATIIETIYILPITFKLFNEERG